MTKTATLNQVGDDRGVVDQIFARNAETSRV